MQKKYKQLITYAMKRLFFIFSVLLFFVSCKNYKILNEESKEFSGSISKCVVEIKLDEAVSEDVLKEIALDIREDRKEYTRLWLFFYLPDLMPDKDGGGAWASASFTPENNPELAINIIGKQLSTNEKNIPFTKYSNVIEMLDSAGDFKQTDGTFKVLSKENENLHIQVSKTCVKNELVNNITDQVKRDIVYVAFQAFAQTDINEFTISSIPIQIVDFKDTKGEYLENYKITITVNREVAKKILKKYLNTESFQDLYQLYEDAVYLPNSKFDRLKFSELDNVFNELKAGR
jgi:hypothetical protein